MACSTPSAWPLIPQNPSSSSTAATVTASSKTIVLSPVVHQNLKFPKLAVSAARSSPDASPLPEEEQPVEESDPVKRAFAKSLEYKKSKASKPDTRGREDEANSKEMDPVKIAMRKAKDYKKDKGVGGGGEIVRGSQNMTVANSRNAVTDNMGSKRQDPTVSSIDFVGLNFSDKKDSPPAGLSPIMDSLPEGDLPEVEIIVGDTSKFRDKKSTKTISDVDVADSELYKPKVSTWGVFPRPDNISEAFGGGRTIHPGEELETAEVKAAKEAHIRESIANYKNRLGLNIDAKTKSKCEKAMRDGDNLMELGKLREALPYYEEVMNSVVFKSELHGLAALQWSICQDSLNRQDDARVMYEKLQSHPNVQVSKKARQFMFGFEAMEMMKVSRFSSLHKTGYESYFEAFLDEKSEYTQVKYEEKQEYLKQVLPYILFLVSPIFILFVIAARIGP